MTALADRTAGRLCVAAVLLAVAGAALHPNDYHSADEYMRRVHANGAWIPVNLLIAVAAVVGTAALAAVARSLEGSPRADLAGYARTVAGASVAVLLVLVALEGFGAARVSDLYAQPAHRAATYPVAYAIYQVTLALLGLWYAVFFGLAPVLLGLAMLAGGPYPGWLGRLGLVAGAAGVVTGALIYLLGSSFLVTTVLFLLVSLGGCAFLLGVARVLLRAGVRV